MIELGCERKLYVKKMIFLSTHLITFTCRQCQAAVSVGINYSSNVEIRFNPACLILNFCFIHSNFQILPFIFLLTAFSPASGRRWLPAKPLRGTRKPYPQRKSSGPVIINKKECNRIVDDLSQSPSLPQLCLRLNETELLDKLKSMGAFNPRYMAINKEDACRFQDLTVNEQPLPRRPSPRPKAKQDQPLENAMNMDLRANGLNDIQDETERLEPENERRQKRMITLSPGSILRGCWNRGSPLDDSSLSRLCTECLATTKLPNDVFPEYINEVICGDDDGNCFGPIGQCAQGVIKFTFLRSTGNFKRNDALSELYGIDIYVEEWEDYEQDIRSCCECRIFSFLIQSRRS